MFFDLLSFRFIETFQTRKLKCFRQKFETFQTRNLKRSKSVTFKCFLYQNKLRIWPKLWANRWNCTSKNFNFINLNHWTPHSFAFPLCTTLSWRLAIHGKRSFLQTIFRFIRKTGKQRTLYRKSYIKLSKGTIEVKRQPGGSASWADEASDATPEQVTVSKAKVSSAEKVREFDAIEHKNDQVNIVLGSSIVAKFESDATIPSDCGIHAYRGSTTKEKLKILKKYNENN